MAGEVAKDRNPKSLGRLTHDDLKQMLTRDWTDGDKTAICPKGFDALPNHLRYIEYTIKGQWPRDWRRQDGVLIPGNSIVQLYGHVGTMEMGWGRHVDARGHFVDNGEVFQATTDAFTAHPHWNAFCFLVSSLNTEANVRIRLRNTTIPNWGASVGDLSIYWEIDPDERGFCETAFNDTDNNNNGLFLQTIRITSQADFARQHANLADDLSAT